MGDIPRGDRGSPPDPLGVEGVLEAGMDVEASRQPPEPGSADAVLCWMEAGASRQFEPVQGEAAEAGAVSRAEGCVDSTGEVRQGSDAGQPGKGAPPSNPHEQLRNRFMDANRGIAAARGAGRAAGSPKGSPRASKRGGAAGSPMLGAGETSEEKGLFATSMECIPHEHPSPVSAAMILASSVGNMRQLVPSPSDSRDSRKGTPLEKSRMQTAAQKHLRSGNTADALAMHEVIQKERIMRLETAMGGNSSPQKLHASSSALSMGQSPLTPLGADGTEGAKPSSRSRTGSMAEVSVEKKTHHQERLKQGESVIERLKNVKALALSSAFNLPRVGITMSIAEVSSLLLTNRSVIIDGWVCERTNKVATDVLWDKAAFMERAVEVTDMNAPVETIVEDIPICPTVSEEDTLDQVWRTMVAFRIEQVGTKNSEGNVTGLLLFDDLYEFVAQHLMKPDAGVPGEESEHVDAPAMNVTGGISPSKAQGKNKGEQEKLRMMNHMVMDAAGDGQQADDLELFDFKRMVALKRGIGRQQLKADRWLRNVYTEASIVILLIIDCVLVIVNAATGSLPAVQGPFMAARGMILFLSMLEALLRIYAYRLDLLNGIHLLECFDIIVVFSSFIIYVAETIPRIALGKTDGGSYASIIIRGFRFVRIVRVLKIMGRFRKFISRNKARYTINGFDLDLCYVTPELVAMSLPAIGAEAHFRNPISEVMRFFHTMHPKKYMIFNLCAERDYDAELFDGRVVRLMVEDHNPPRLDQIISFVEQCAEFLSEDPQHIVAVHCKGGKGRTGVAVCAWLIYSTFSSSAEDAMEFFALKRTGNRAKAVQGVSGVSQRRYLHYIEKVFANGGFNHTKRVLKTIKLVTTPSTGQGGSCRPWFTVEENGYEVWNSVENGTVETMNKADESKVFSLSTMSDEGFLGLKLMGDVRICFYHNEFLQGDDLFCYLWFHTDFVHGCTLDFAKQHIDGAWSDTQCRIFRAPLRLNPIMYLASDNFHIVMTFDTAPPVSTMTARRQVRKPDFRIIERARNMRESEGFEYRVPMKRTPSEHTAAASDKTQSKTFDNIIVGDDDEERCDPGGASENWDAAMAHSKWTKIKQALPDIEKAGKQLARGVSMVAASHSSVVAARTLAMKTATSTRKSSLISPRKRSSLPETAFQGVSRRSSEASGSSKMLDRRLYKTAGEADARRRSSVSDIGMRRNIASPQNHKQSSSLGQIVREAVGGRKSSCDNSGRDSAVGSVSSSSVPGESFKSGTKQLPPVASLSPDQCAQSSGSVTLPVAVWATTDVVDRSMSPIMSEADVGSNAHLFSRVESGQGDSVSHRSEEDEVAPRSPASMRVAVPGGPVDGRDEVPRPRRGNGGRADGEEMC